jgi:kinesin family member 2/24
LQQDDFIARAMRTAGVRAEQAKALYFKLWSLHIDSRALLMKNPTNNSSDGAVRKNARTTASQVHIKPGMFFRLSAGCADEGVMVVMVMGPEESAIGKDDKIYVCAEVCHAEGIDVYELFVARQRVVKGVELRDEVVMEYNSATRYYCTKS